MFTETTITMYGDRDAIFRLGSEIERWPAILPHYRAVTLYEYATMEDRTVRKTATMQASRFLPVGTIPVAWKTILEIDDRTQTLHFVHIGGFTKGMDVYWHLTPDGTGTKVTITHDWQLRWPLIGGWVTGFVCHQFVDAIARRTLRCIKTMVEITVPMKGGARA